MGRLIFPNFLFPPRKVATVMKKNDLFRANEFEVLFFPPSTSPKEFWGHTLFAELFLTLFQPPPPLPPSSARPSIATGWQKSLVSCVTARLVNYLQYFVNVAGQAGSVCSRHHRQKGGKCKIPLHRFFAPPDTKQCINTFHFIRTSVVISKNFQTIVLQYCTVHTNRFTLLKKLKMFWTPINKKNILSFLRYCSLTCNVQE